MNNSDEIPKFKEFYYNLLREAPMFIGDSRESYSLDTIMATEKYSEIMENPEKFTKVYSANDEIPVDLYEERDGNEVICWFVPTNNNFISGYVAYNILPDGGVETSSVFNDKNVKFLAHKVYLHYLLTKYPFIISDKRHTGSGKRFWENLVLWALGHKYKVSTIDSSTSELLENISNVKDLEKYYGDIESEKYRIKIEKYDKR